jgi:hypothetical protein
MPTSPTHLAESGIIFRSWREVKAIVAGGAVDETAWRFCVAV